MAPKEKHETSFDGTVPGPSFRPKARPSRWEDEGSLCKASVGMFKIQPMVINHGSAIHEASLRQCLSPSSGASASAVPSPGGPSPFSTTSPSSILANAF